MVWGDRARRRDPRRLGHRRTLRLGAAPGLIFGAACLPGAALPDPGRPTAGSASYDHAGAAAHAPRGSALRTSRCVPARRRSSRRRASMPRPSRRSSTLPVARRRGRVRAISERVREAARAAGRGGAGAGGRRRSRRSGTGRRRSRLDAARGRAGRPEADQGASGRSSRSCCTSLGIYHFDQIAGWGPAEVAWIDANLEGFAGA